MADTRRMLVFFIVVLGVWTLMHVYVVARIWALPGFATPTAHRILLAATLALWLAYPLARILARGGHDDLARPLELVGGLWMGVLFFALTTLLVADLVTGFGLFLPNASAALRQAALALTVILSVAATIQGTRRPAVRNVTVALPDLPPSLHGVRLVQLSDLHVGALLGTRFFESIVTRVKELEPDIVVITGDLIDGDIRKVEDNLPSLRTLEAPLGVWAVTGNHEFYAGLEPSVEVLRRAGYRVLRDQADEVSPGLVFVGVDDLTARRQFGWEDQPLQKAFAERPAGAVVLLSHSPWQVEEAAELGASLMLSGHTHGGQIWPFDSLVRLSYPYLAGLYTVGEMTLLVSRGTGTWGPRMRLWKPAEINVVTFVSPSAEARPAID